MRSTFHPAEAMGMDSDEAGRLRRDRNQRDGAGQWLPRREGKAEAGGATRPLARVASFCASGRRAWSAARMASCSQLADMANRVLRVFNVRARPAIRKYLAAWRTQRSELTILLSSGCECRSQV
jgi:hypothetical protein